MTWLKKLQQPADDIIRLNGVLSVTVAMVEGVDSYTVGDCGLNTLQFEAAKMLDRLGLDTVTIVIDHRRIIVTRWNEFACAVTVSRTSPANKSIRRTIFRVGRKYDRRDPDDTQLGKALGELERTVPEVAQAANNYDRVTEEILDGKPV